MIWLINYKLVNLYLKSLSVRESITFVGRELRNLIADGKNEYK